MSFTKATTLILDLGDVLFSWSSHTETSIPPRTLKAILASPTWADYECGLISQQDCYDRISNEFHIPPSEIAKAFNQARDSLESNDEILDFVRELKYQSDDQLRVYAMSNISRPDHDYLRTKPVDWSLFDKVYTSADAGERKPNLGFYRYVLDDTAADPRSVVFVDDKPENVLSARSFGMRGIVFDDQKRALQAIRNAIEDPVQRARSYLQSNAKLLFSVTSNGVVLKENFAQLLMLEATCDPNLVSLVEHEREWNFFQGKPVLTTEVFPCDLDTTSIALTVTGRSKEVISSVMDEMLNYVDKDGIIQTYFDHRRLRFDPVVCVNVLTLFHANGRGDELHRTFAWVQEVLINRGYIDGTRYYATPESFLFFMARLLEQIKGTKADLSLRYIFRERVQERIGSEGDALALAMRILACASVGIRDEMDLRTLLSLQQEDGGWEAGWLYKYGSSGTTIGNRGLTTALAINAIEALNHLPQTPLYQPQLPVLKSYRISIVSPVSPVAGDRPQSRAKDKNRHKRSSSASEWAHSLRKRFHWPWVNLVTRVVHH
ncbi:HAD-like protein [Thelephora ganbajun]|uniref:HAD-like protein n=1 Tax=Thelephora ganbajun TaxID=370292 RepID=A0ACB6ZLA5_THEGA|nr:HAD-like protein [Thelephora ganbajun]